MTWFSLPATGATAPGGFHDARSATGWLAGLPQTNATAMLGELTAQIDADNAFATPARERFKTLEALRKAVFAVTGESLRRFENRALPFAPAEQSLLVATCRLWRACATGYLHCLRASLDADEGLAGHSARVAHRALTCLRMEQWHCYSARGEVDGECWRLMHAVYAAAEAMSVLAEVVTDALPRETAESTVNGLYGMGLLLHLADPFALTHTQFAAAARWLARWRELVVIRPQLDPRASACLPLDLRGTVAVLADPQPEATELRWLVLDAVLRKLRKRSEALRAGESPESLKLGNTLSAEACASLLETLSERYRQPVSIALAPQEGGPVNAAVEVVWGLENIYYRLGGRDLAEPSPTATYTGRLRAEQLAVFGHVVDPARDRVIPSEQWAALRRAGGAVDLRRTPAAADARVVLRQLLMLRTSPEAPWFLATVSRLCARGQAIWLTAMLESGTFEAVAAEQRDRASGQLVRAPGLMHTAPDGRCRVVLPAGVNLPLRPPRLIEARTETPVVGQLGRLIDRGGDHEWWSLNEATGVRA